ncbi:MAG: LysR substrate-binding domain-containing protein [Candidatus Hydrogenedentes bacterium]|nr:LysR substrate-binding domain-containing protein [Candidatus Hydrogenedentota bacterium]
MTLRDLQYVVALSETRHFGQAAGLCHVSQPTLSMQIAKLEQELGAPLFERTNRRVILTDTGQRVAVHAETILAEVRRLQESARQPATGLTGPFYLGVIPTVGPYLLPYILPKLRRLHPKLELYLREETTARLLERMRRGKLDAAILSLPLDDHTVDYEVFYVEKFVAALPGAHRLAARERLRLADLAGENLLLLEEGNCMRDQTLELCKGPRNNIVDEYRASTIESLRQMVAAGMGCSFLPELSTTSAHANSSLVAIRPFVEPAPTREIVIAWRKTYPRASAIRELGKALQKRLAKRSAE